MSVEVNFFPFLIFSCKNSQANGTALSEDEPWYMKIQIYANKVDSPWGGASRCSKKVARVT